MWYCQYSGYKYSKESRKSTLTLIWSRSQIALFERVDRWEICRNRQVVARVSCRAALLPQLKRWSGTHTVPRAHCVRRADIRGRHSLQQNASKRRIDPKHYLRGRNAERSQHRAPPIIRAILINRYWSVVIDHIILSIRSHYQSRCLCPPKRSQNIWLR